MDIFVETLVRRKFTPGDKKKIMALFVSLILGSIIFILVIPGILLANKIAYLSTLSMIIFAVMVFVIWRKLKKMNIEFEYIITNDTLDFDKIIDRKKRERQISIDIKSVEEIGFYDANKFKGAGFNYILHAERELSGIGNYYIIVPHPKLKRSLIVFSPDDRMLEAHSKTLPRQLVKSISK